MTNAVTIPGIQNRPKRGETGASLARVYECDPALISRIKSGKYPMSTDPPTAEDQAAAAVLRTVRFIRHRRIGKRPYRRRN